MLLILPCSISFHCTDVTAFTHQREPQLHNWLEFHMDEAHFTQNLSTVSPTCTTPSRVFRELSWAGVHTGMGSSGEHSVIFWSQSHVAFQHQDMTLSPIPHPICTLRGLVWLSEHKEQGHHPSHRHLQDQGPLWTQQSQWCYFSSASGKKRDAGNNSLPLNKIWS